MQYSNSTCVGDKYNIYKGTFVPFIHMTKYINLLKINIEEGCLSGRLSGMNKAKIAQKYASPPGGLEPPTFRLTAERASRLRHGGR